MPEKGKRLNEINKELRALQKRWKNLKFQIKRIEGFDDLVSFEEKFNLVKQVINELEEEN
jgi:hypothetical protein